MNDFEIIREYIPDLKSARLVETLDGDDYGGDFRYFTIKRAAQSGAMPVCLFQAFRSILDPFYSSGTFPAIDGVEDGLGLAAIGCFFKSSGKVLRRTDPRAKSGLPKGLVDDLRVSVDGEYYYLYLLVPPSTAQS